MALRITDAEGNDLLASAPAPQQTVAAPHTGRIFVYCVATETADLPVQYLAGTLSWNDGSLPVVYNGTTAGTLVIDTYRNLVPGDYNVQLVVHNYSWPTPETVGVSFLAQVAPSRANPATKPLIYGPILPKDEGYPNTSQWNFDRGTDLEILASSLKMLLLTRQGERIMEPDYGTRLHSLLFLPQTSGFESVVQHEITEALTRWEPRVELRYFQVEKTGDREIKVTATFASRLNQSEFVLPLTFNL